MYLAEYQLYTIVFYLLKNRCVVFYKVLLYNLIYGLLLYSELIILKTCCITYF